MQREETDELTISKQRFKGQIIDDGLTICVFGQSTKDNSTFLNTVSQVFVENVDQ